MRTTLRIFQFTHKGQTVDIYTTVSRKYFGTVNGAPAGLYTAGLFSDIECLKTALKRAIDQTISANK